MPSFKWFFSKTVTMVAVGWALSIAPIGMTPGLAGISCQIERHAPEDFSKVVQQEPVPDPGGVTPSNTWANKDADFCVLTHAGTGGGGQTWCDISHDDSGWLVQASSPASSAGCFVTCFKLTCK
jgi:hypothetical protein